jgi:hypothetical protein
VFPEHHLPDIYPQSPAFQCPPSPSFVCLLTSHLKYCLCFPTSLTHGQLSRFLGALWAEGKQEGPRLRKMGSAPPWPIAVTLCIVGLPAPMPSQCPVLESSQPLKPISNIDGNFHDFYQALLLSFESPLHSGIQLLLLSTWSQSHLQAHLALLCGGGFTPTSPLPPTPPGPGLPGLLLQFLTGHSIEKSKKKRPIKS